MSALLSREQISVGPARSADASALPPVLLVLLTLMLFFLLVGPNVFIDAPLVARVSMITVFVTASAACLISLVEPGEVTSVTIEKDKGIVTLDYTGLFAKSARQVAFSDIATVGLEVKRDRQGFQTAVPVVMLRSKRSLPLPAGTTEADIAMMRAIISGGLSWA